MSTICHYPKPAILAHLPPRGHALIAASAGTGKTYTLEHLVVDLLLSHEDVENLEQILVVTFTEKATSELKVRIRKVIRAILDVANMSSRMPDHPRYARYLSPPENGAPYWTIDEAAVRKLERALLSFDVAPIHTIHAFCQKILTEYAFANQRMFDQQHVEFAQLFDRAFTDTMRRTLARTPELRDWLEAWLETSTVEELRWMLMGALTSKAEIWPRFDEARIMAGLERFGEDLWGRYREVYRRRCDGREAAFGRAQRSWVTQRSLPRFLMLADKEMIDFKHSLRESKIETKEQHDFLKFTVSLLRFKPAVLQKFLPIMERAMEREKQRTGAYTFDDMLEMLWKSISPERGATGAWLVRTLRRRYRFALIDEFQDTDEIQWKIFQKLFTQSDSERERLIIIGDPKQAIYGFRNADVHTYLDAREELLGHRAAANDDVAKDETQSTHTFDCVDESETKEQRHTEDFVLTERGAVLYLHYNFRSTSRLIEGYNAILDQGAKSPFFSGEAIDYRYPVRCGNTSLRLLDATRAREPAAIIVGKMKRRENEQFKSSRVDDLYACYGKWVADEITHILSDEGALFVDSGGEEGEEPRRLTASDVFVLTRTRYDEVKLEKHLKRAQIPYTFVRQTNLFSTPQAQHVYDLLRAIERPRERGRRLRAWSTPFFDIDLDELTRCRDVAETHALYKNLLHWHVLAREQRFEELCTHILERSGLVRREIFFSEDQQQLTDYNQLFDVLLEEAHLGRCDIHELIARTRAFMEEQRKPLVQHGDVRRVEEREDAVQILTMHKSKGLEAEIVFLFPFGGMNGDSWRFHYKTKDGQRVRAMHVHKPEAKISPNIRSRVEQEDRQESERLFYVALTRAKSRLYLPFVPYIGSQPCCKTLSQRSYHVLNERLRAVLDELSSPPESGESREGTGEVLRPSWHETFELRDIPYFGIQPDFDDAQGQEALEAMQAWMPQATWIARHDYDEARAREDHAKVASRVQYTASYSSLKRREGSSYQTIDAAVDDQERVVDAEVGGGAIEEDIVREDELPGGVRTGLFLHAMLENLDYSSLTRYQSVEAWQHDAHVHETFSQGLKEYGLEPIYLELSQRIVWRALRAKVEFDHGVIYDIGLCTPNIRELEFLYPIHASGALNASAQRDLFANARTTIEQGFIKGYVDYTFEWGGRVYFADWKSDVLARYNDATLAQHFEANYTKQAFLYSVALCKMFSIEDEGRYKARFGGGIYCFLRGMQEDSRKGLHAWRPSWSALQEFERALLDSALHDPTRSATP